MAPDLIRDQDGDVLGVTALGNGDRRGLHPSRPRPALFATWGGAGRIYAASTNAFINNTGDGLGMAARAGVPLEDMEFWQFRPDRRGRRGRAGSPGRRARRRRYPAQRWLELASASRSAMPWTLWKDSGAA
ncbi:FAD-binding protein [Cupriavidus basilensis]